MPAIAIAPTDEREMNKSNMSRSGRAIYRDHALKPIFPGVIRGCSVQGRCIPTPTRTRANFFPVLRHITSLLRCLLQLLRQPAAE